jgi:hypothetical protein
MFVGHFSFLPPCAPFRNVTGKPIKDSLDFYFAEMHVVAEFWLNESNIDEQKYKQYKNKTPTWYGGSTTVPLDTPPCGFHGELCHTSEKSDSMFTFNNNKGIYLNTIIISQY